MAARNTKENPMSRTANSANANQFLNAALSRRSFLGALGASGLALGLTACGGSGSDASGSASGSSSASAASGTTTITIGTEGTYAPYSYLDDDNNLTGFDVEVARAIGEKLDNYEFEFQTIEWSSMFASLDADKIQTVSNQVALNDERKEKYLFEDTPYSYSVEAIAFKAGRTDIKTIEDLHGKTVIGGTTSANTTWLENYNAEHGDPITISYGDGDISKMLQEILNDRVDATINSPVSIQRAVDEQGLDIDYVIFTDIDPEPIYFPFADTDAGAELRDAVEGALQELLDDGTVAELSEKFLGADYTTLDAVQELVDAQ